MATRVRSYSKINLGLAIGPVRGDGFHGLTTLYQTLELHDVVTVKAERLGAGSATRIAMTTNHPYVPKDERNTAWKMVERVLDRMGIRAAVEIDIEKNLPVQGGLGAGSANAAAALEGLERELGEALPGVERLKLAAGVGSDVPLFLLGGTVLGLGRGEEVLPLPDVAEEGVACVIAVPGVGVSTPQAFKDWDKKSGEREEGRGKRDAPGVESGLTEATTLDRLRELSLVYAACYADSGQLRPGPSGIVPSQTPEKKQVGPDGSWVGDENDLAENTLLALVRTGIENDFEEVVFGSYPSLREIKRVLMGSDLEAAALYASLSGSGSALFGLYRSVADAEAAQQRVQAQGIKALLTATLPRARYWSRMFAG